MDTNESDPRAEARADLCPDGRISRSTQDRDGHLVVDLENYVPHLLSAVNNTLSRGASQEYLDRFDIGIVEWRVMSMLAIEPRIQATQICEIIKIDKGAASRALSRLDEKGLVEHEVLASDPRKRIWWLSKSGLELHETILQLALGRERRLITGIDPRDLEAFLRAIRIMTRNVEAMR
ncbi:MarR family winged helix-turn-helix transcriptional regulator [Pararhodobacter sp.]|uniref:MarR family winged helix-turn-helix transcriptional regulator n=1 Tax=Pararhodobacter sp. TaxID=2127056 RepID=UPI002AFF829F|nr:MarR family winged helix-turn-helix transcriptional regulator [Pararhodobacter sp.]